MQVSGWGMGENSGWSLLPADLVSVTIKPLLPLAHVMPKRLVRNWMGSSGTASYNGDIALSRAGPWTLGTNFPTKPIPGSHLIL